MALAALRAGANHTFNEAFEDARKALLLAEEAASEAVEKEQRKGEGASTSLTAVKEQTRDALARAEEAEDAKQVAQVKMQQLEDKLEKKKKEITNLATGFKDIVQKFEARMAKQKTKIENLNLANETLQAKLNKLQGSREGAAAKGRGASVSSEEVRPAAKRSASRSPATRSPPRESQAAANRQGDRSLTPLQRRKARTGTPGGEDMDVSPSSRNPPAAITQRARSASSDSARVNKRSASPRRCSRSPVRSAERRKSESPRYHERSPSTGRAGRRRSSSRRRSRSGSRGRGRGHSRSRSRSLQRPGKGRGKGKDKGKEDKDGNGLCFLFVTGKCLRGTNCHFWHPEGDNCRGVLESLSKKACRFGAECRRADCVFRHPEERQIPQKKADFGSGGDRN